jgi:uncharacterized protein (DUF885 family)
MGSAPLAAAGDAYWQWVLRTEPTWATYLSDPRYHDQLPRIGPADIDRQLAELRALQAQAAAVDASGLDDADKVTRSILDHLIASQITERELKFHQWNIDQMMGPQVWLLELLNYHPFRIEKDVLDLISRFQAFPRHIDEHLANLRQGLDEGRVAPKVAVARVMGQLEAILATPPDKSPLALALAKRPPSAAAFDGRILGAIRDAVYPAYAKYLDFLKSDYAPRAREEVGVWATAGGDTAYAFRVRHHTTTNLTPDQLHEIGRVELKSILDEMAAIAKKLGHSGDVKSFFAKLMADPSNFWGTREEIVAHFERVLAKCQEALPRAFGRLPKTACIVKQIEEYREKDCVAAFYYQPPEDLSRPGIFYANTYQPQTRLKCNNAALTVHEAVPGHHLQIAISVEMEGLPPFRRHGMFTAFVEGWALYTERLADELGLYENDLERFGMLTYQAWRACRLVVDTGLHAKRWTRNQAIEFFRENIALGDTEIVNEVDRYIIWPGQALAYKVGQREISRLRAEAEKTMGPAFDLRGFHDEVLRHGALPLTTLEETVRRWSSNKPAV